MLKIAVKTNVFSLPKGKGGLEKNEPVNGTGKAIQRAMEHIMRRGQKYFDHPLVVGYVPCNPDSLFAPPFFYLAEARKKRLLGLPYTRERLVFAIAPAILCCATHREREKGDAQCQIFDTRINHVATEELGKYSRTQNAVVQVGAIRIAPENGVYHA